LEPPPPLLIHDGKLQQRVMRRELNTADERRTATSGKTKNVKGQLP
jgi:hypothetical protein